MIFLSVSQGLLLYDGYSAFVAQCHTAILECCLVLFSLISTHDNSRGWLAQGTGHSEVVTIGRDIRGSPSLSHYNKGCYKSIPHYFMENPVIGAPGIPYTPFLTSFIVLMNCITQLVQPTGGADSSTPHGERKNR